MKRKDLIAVLFCAGIFVLTSCKGSTGPAGASSTTQTAPLVMSFQNGVLPSTTYAGEVDCYIDAGNPTTSYPNNALTGYTATDDYRALIKFDVSSIVPPTVQVTSAYLTMYILYQGLSAYPSLTAYQINTLWLDTATWNSPGIGSWTNPGGDYNPAPVSNIEAFSNNSWIMTFTLNTSMVQSWISSPQRNYGLIIIAQNEGTTSYGYYGLGYGTYGALNQRPILTIYYTLQ